ncbi:hypothetical protein BG261_02205 [Floricoccus tropicus]|uniref:DUF2969 domain-containing protein n=1 Tax=Floricoccus tropicus TaxID=1859473 RepID=A0A1E8GME4_9LACT|nr:DUF2969 family protein [Floricoccus tropicus]OFI49412.1 hypothetical protein BG261_02205 [Floricoccus tropicus]
MSKKKDIEIQVVDTDAGVNLVIGKKVVAEIIENDGKFLLRENSKDKAQYKNYSVALEEAIKNYNLSL